MASSVYNKSSAAYSTTPAPSIPPCFLPQRPYHRISPTLHKPQPTPQTAWAAHSRGVGQLIGQARAAGARTVVVGLGGSACTAGGRGLVNALGGFESAAGMLAGVDLVVATEHQREADSAAAGSCLAEAFGRGSFDLPQFDHELKQFIARVNLVAQALPGLDFPAFYGAALVAALGRAFQGLTLVKEAQSAPLRAAVATAVIADTPRSTAVANALALAAAEAAHKATQRRPATPPLATPTTASSSRRTPHEREPQAQR